MKNQLREQQSPNVSCKDHKQKCTFVCLHKTCHHSFSIGCQKCRKDHGQHPNRLISLQDFHRMLSKPILYMQNSTAFKLMNLKKKIQTTILEKQVELMQSNQHIKNTIASILEQHYKIRDVVSHLDSEALINNFQDYITHLHKCKEFMAYNPVKANLVFNNEVIKSSRVILEKHLKKSHDLTDNIRQFLVKIIEVLLANCAHEEDDDDIEFENEGDNPANFNIAIKIRTDVTQNPNIKSLLEHETFLEMFDEEKEAMNQQIDILEKELDLKTTILNKIKSSSHIIKEKDNQSNEPENQEKNQEIECESKRNKLSGQLRYTADSLFEKEKINNELLELKQEYQAVISSKEEYIYQLKETIQKLNEKIDDLQHLKERENDSAISSELFEQKNAMLDEYENANSVLKIRLEEMDENAQKNKIQLDRKQKEISDLKKNIEELEKQALSHQLNLQTKKSSENDIETIQKQKDVIRQLQEQLTKRQSQIGKQKKKYSDLEKLVQKMNQNSEQSNKELIQWRDQHQQRQKVLRISLENSQLDIEHLHQKIKAQNERIRVLEEQLQLKNKQIEQKKQLQQLQQHLKQISLLGKQADEKIKIANEKEQQAKKQMKAISQKQQELKEHTKKLADKETKLQQQAKKLSEQQKQIETMRSSKKTESTSRPSQDQNKKIREMKQMLQISIKKNQELKNRNYELQRDLFHFKQQAQMKESQVSQSNQRRALCQENKSRINTHSNQSPETVKIETINSECFDPPSPTFKKKQGELCPKNRKGVSPKEDKRQAYMEIKALFKTVTEDMNVLEDRLKENTVIEKVYLKELERKRTQNKNLKKELQNVKLYGGPHKQTQLPRNTSPISRGTPKDKHEFKGNKNSPINTKAVPNSQGVSKRVPKEMK